MLTIDEEREVWVVYTGRLERPSAVCRLRATALRVARGMPSSVVKMSPSVVVGGIELVPAPVIEPDLQDIQDEEAMKRDDEARATAEQKARGAGLTDEDISDLRRGHAT